MTDSLEFAAAADIVAFVPLTSLDLAPSALLLGNIRFLELDQVANRSQDHARKALQVLTLHQSRDTLYPHISPRSFQEEAVVYPRLAEQLPALENLERTHLGNFVEDSLDFEMRSLVLVPSG